MISVTMGDNRFGSAGEHSVMDSVGPEFVGINYYKFAFLISFLK